MKMFTRYIVDLDYKNTVLYFFSVQLKITVKNILMVTLGKLRTKKKLGQKIKAAINNKNKRPLKLREDFSNDDNYSEKKETKMKCSGKNGELIPLYTFFCRKQ